ncbi:MAG TPA: PAS domain-containing sensor histidine kinase [Myxococcaceae bacterium]|nr:PAS domain-containing sensor histidine kinase [Myxococcaceae bacterium]
MTTDASSLSAGSTPRASGWLAAALGIGLAAAFNALAPAVAQVTPYMSFHLVLPVVAWFSRSLRVAWTAVLVAALTGNLLSMPPEGVLTRTPGAIGAGLAFILIQAAFTLSIVLLRRRMKDRELLLIQLRTERDRLLSLFAHAPVAVVTYRGPDLVYDFVSPGAQRLSDSPLVGRPMREVLGDREGKDLLERVERVYRTGESLVLTEQRVRYRREGGREEESYVDATYTPLRDARGRVEGVLSCAVDVTAGVQARRQLERTEQQLRRLSDAGLLGIAEWRGDRIVGANRRLLEMLGYPPDSGVPEGGISGKAMTPPEFAEADARTAAELASTGRSSSFEKQLIRTDGSRIWIFGGSAVVDRETASGVAFVLDITAQKQAERALQEAHQFEQRLLGIVSHDLRNPLASIRLGVDLLARSTLSEHQLRTVTRMARSAERMHQLIAGLLDLTLLRAGQQLPISREASNMHLLVERAVEEVSVADPGRIRVTGHGDGSGEWDNVRVGQALGNLLGNALQHSPPGSQVRVEVEGGTEQVRVSISNGGEPIPREQRESLFEPFRRGVRPGALDGSVGLGLYIAWHVAQAHRGTIEVSSSAGAGTTFRLILPKWASSRPSSAPGEGARGVSGPRDPPFATLA